MMDDRRVSVSAHQAREDDDGRREAQLLPLPSGTKGLSAPLSGGCARCGVHRQRVGFVVQIGLFVLCVAQFVMLYRSYVVGAAACAAGMVEGAAVRRQQGPSSGRVEQPFQTLPELFPGMPFTRGETSGDGMTDSRRSNTHRPSGLPRADEPGPIRLDNVYPQHPARDAGPYLWQR